MPHSLLDLIGHTPLWAAENFSRLYQLSLPLFVKCECFNPGGSIKDRTALYLIKEAERQGQLQPGATIIEPTSGNTGVGLGLVAAAKGYRLLLTMPESMSIERRQLLAALGAELVLTPAELGMQGAVDKAQELLQSIPGAFLPDQFNNPANPLAHYETTAEEIWADSEGKIDILVASFGTGGTLSGCGKRLREYKPGLQIISLEPEQSQLLAKGQAGPHGLQGIGANFIPQNLDRALIDELLPVSDAAAIAKAQEFAQAEGLLVGISSGAALAAAVQIARRAENLGKNIVVILPDGGERYLSTGLYEKAANAEEPA